MKEIKKVFFFFVCLCLLSGMFSGPASASTAEAAFQKGVAALKNGDHKTAEREFRRAAEQGHLSAQIRLGLGYLCYDDEEAAK